jgi:hypothetical protein
MSEQISKLTPDRDLQAYFLTPSAIAALSSANSTGFVLSGKWRQQFDWAVVEWNRDNVFEHPSLRNLPDGDLSGLTLTYQESRMGCIPFQSNLFPVVTWDRLRLWVANDDGTDTIYYVNLMDYAVSISGSTVAASATMTLVASPGVGNRAGLAFLEEHYYYIVGATDELSDIAAGIAAAINLFSSDFTASASGSSVTVTWKGSAGNHNLDGANGNRMSLYGFAENGAAVWQSPGAGFSGGAFPNIYQVTLDFGNLMGTTSSAPINSSTALVQVPTTSVRKVRWTWQADLQLGQFAQTEFQVTVSNWSVSGANRLYSIAGPGSRRIEDTDTGVAFLGDWTLESGNYSDSKAHYSTTAGDSVTITYTEATSHQLYLGTRRFTSAPRINITIDSGEAQQTILTLSQEDVLVRYPLGTIAGGSHTVTVSNAENGQKLYFDFLEIAYPGNNLPDFTPNSQLALATDWDTYHSQSLPAERTAWLINKLGYTGRVNHYVGALWFYEIVRTGTQYATLTIQIQLAATIGANAQLTFALAADVPSLSFSTTRTDIAHLILLDDTSATVALAVAALINIGTNLVWAAANGNSLTLTARAMGADGNGIGFELLSSTSDVTVTVPANALAGGIDGTPYTLTADGPGGLNTTLIAAAEFWRTDLTASQPINRAARDWHAAYFAAIKAYGMDVVAAFSTELMNGDPSAAVGIAQQYFDGTPVVLNTPAIQTNFSPTSLAYWKRVYLEMAGLQSAAGLVPYLQSGEVQWWYFPSTGVSMPFYDAYTQQQFTAKYGVAMQEIPSNNSDPSAFPNEVAFLPTLIGNYTASIRSALQTQFPGCRYEVLYPTDTNNTALNALINYPAADWTPRNLTCLKTESFGFTGGHDLVSCTMSMSTSAAKGFPNPQRAHLVGIGDAWSAWLKEVDIAQSQGLETVVLFALDQYCLIGYPPPPFVNSTKSSRQG